ncbi:polysaccharide biosynthesis tyrosine autokinase [Lyngbya aestuarii]|uniref:polysaccharide biosynthesis tyrosine autokinase n=1 Tax=Lyngbya aestuarii TaxID=118322 RepID=UPI00403E31CE
MALQEYPEDIDFQKYWLILKRHWLLATGVWGIVVIIATLMAFSVEPRYEAFGKLKFKKQNATSGLVTEAGEKIGKLDSLNTKDTPLDTEAEVIRSAPIVNQTIEALNLKDEEGKPVTYEEFLQSLNVEGIRGTDILIISYQSRATEEAVEVVDTVMALYTKNNILVNRSEAVAARKFISEQLPKTEQIVRKAEASLRNFKERNNIVDLEQEAKFAVGAIDTLDSQIKQSQAELEKVTGQVGELQQKLGTSSEGALARNYLSESSGVQQALVKLQEVEDQLAVARSRFQEQHPRIIALESEKASLTELLEGRVSKVIGKQQAPDGIFQTGELQENLSEYLVIAEAQRLGIIKQLESLNRIQSVQRQRAKVLPELEQTQRDLERQLEAAQSTYEILLNNLQQVQIAENQNVGNAQIISEAVASKYPVSTSKKIVIAAGIVVGSLLYIVTAFILELADPSIKTTKEVRNILKYTLLGMIPSSRKKLTFSGIKTTGTAPERQVRDLPDSLISEAYKMLQANLKFLSPDRELKVIVVTSSVPKEGKSTVSANLAMAIAQLGSRVLLIDADLHHPQQHHIWELTNEVGLSEAIVGRAELNKSVKRVTDNLDVLPSGVVPPNSLALLDSKRMNSLIEDFSKAYDLVIIDTSPLLLVADALTLGKMSDGILLVVRPGVIDTVSANATRERLIQSGQNVLGLVINGVIVENEPDSYFHHAKSYSDKVAKQPITSVFKS